MARWGSLLEDDLKVWRPADLDPWLDKEEEQRHETAFFCQKLKDIFSAFPHFGVPHEPTQIVNGVFLGTTCDAENVDLVNRYGITHVINCSGRKPLNPRSRRRPDSQVTSGVVGYVLLEIEDVDDDDCNLKMHFRRTNDYIRRARVSGGRVMVCCSGASRGAGIVMGYLLGVKSMYLLEAAKLLKDLRHVAICNDNFVRQLVEYARDVGVLDVTPRKVKAPTFGTSRDRTRLLDVHLPEVNIVKGVYKYRFDRFLY